MSQGVASRPPTGAKVKSPAKRSATNGAGNTTRTKTVSSGMTDTPRSDVSGSSSSKLVNDSLAQPPVSLWLALKHQPLDSFLFVLI